MNDRDLEYEVLKLKPVHLEEAVGHAVRLEALTDSVNARTTGSGERAGGRTQSRPRSVFAVSDEEQEKDGNADLLQRIAQLEKQLNQSTKGSKGSSSKKASSKENGGRNSTGCTESAQAAGEESRAGPDTHPCYICKELGHWQKDCPKRKNKPKEEANVQPVLSISANMSPTKIYALLKSTMSP